MTQIAMLGTGIMGAAMARNLLKNGHGVAAWNRTRERAEPLAADGATVAGSPAEAVEGADVVMTMLNDGDTALAVLTDAAPALRDGRIWAQMGTVGVDDVPRLAAFAAEHGATFVDSPVQGTRQPAEQGKLMVADAWSKGTDAQRKEFQDLFLTLFGKIAFPKIRKNFENLDTVLYEEPTVEGDTAKIASTILINHPLKKQELKVKYQLVKQSSAWKVVDVAVLGDSMLIGIRDDQVQPLLKEGGWDALLKAMREKAAELKDIQLK